MAGFACQLILQTLGNEGSGGRVGGKVFFYLCLSVNGFVVNGRKDQFPFFVRFDWSFPGDSQGQLIVYFVCSGT